MSTQLCCSSPNYRQSNITDLIWAEWNEIARARTCLFSAQIVQAWDAFTLVAHHEKQPQNRWDFRAETAGWSDDGIAILITTGWPPPHPIPPEEPCRGWGGKGKNTSLLMQLDKLLPQDFYLYLSHLAGRLESSQFPRCSPEAYCDILLIWLLYNLSAASPFTAARGHYATSLWRRRQ